MNLIHLEKFLFAFTVVKVHHVIWILYAAVGARTRFKLV